MPWIKFRGPQNRYSTKQNINGLVIIVGKVKEKYVKESQPLSDRVGLLKLNTMPHNLNIIQIYAPTSKSIQEIKEFYQDLDQVLKETWKQEINIILRDFNSKIGKGKDGDVVCDDGLGTRNKNREILVKFSKQNKYLVQTRVVPRKYIPGNHQETTRET